MKSTVLIIDDEPAICASLSLALKDKYVVHTALSAYEGLRLLEERGPHVVLLDLKIDGVDGMDVLRRIKAATPETPVIIMTAYGSIRSSVQAMRAGAFYYLPKPLDPEEVEVFIAQALAFRALNDRVNYLSSELQSRVTYGEMIGKSPPMQRVYDTIEKVKDSNVSVLLTGESGTGKELAARAIHYFGGRKDNRFVPVNCIAIPEGLLEGEFFGHVKGSFTGALKDTRGKLEAADRGTLFLDEVGDMPLALQGKLLRVLQEKEFSPIGSTELKQVDIRIIAATNRDLMQMIRDGTFRQELYYRLNVVNIHMPPLKERKEDIPLIINHFLDKCSQEHQKPRPDISSQALRILMDYDYPGNVRELANFLEYTFVLCDGKAIKSNDLPSQLTGQAQAIACPPPEDTITDYLSHHSLADIERDAIRATMERLGGHQRNTAAQLGISERTLRYKLAAPPGQTQDIPE